MEESTIFPGLVNWKDTTTQLETDTIDNSTRYTYKLPYDDGWVIASSVVLGVLFVFGITANSITIAVIGTSNQLKNRYYTFITSMCASDIVSAFTSILFLYRRTWGFLYFAWPEFFCKLYWGVDLWTSFSTALHIMSFAILRMIGVKWPTVFQRISPRYMNLWIGSIWTVTFLCAFIPHFIFNTVKNIDRENDPDNARWASCSLDPKWIPTWQIYVQFVYAFFLYLPAAVIISISVSIAVILKRKGPPGDKRLTDMQLTSLSKMVAESNEITTITTSATSSNSVPNKQRIVKNSTGALARYRKDRQAIIQLWLIVGSFLVGYIPLTAFHFYTGLTLSSSNNEINTFDWRFAMVQYMLLRFSECLNPIFYNLASAKMRNETKIFLRWLLRKRNLKSHSHKSVGTSSNI